MNGVTAYQFFDRFPSLLPFLLGELRRAVSSDNSGNSDNSATGEGGVGSAATTMHPSLYPVLLLLARLQPSMGDEEWTVPAEEGGQAAAAVAAAVAAAAAAAEEEMFSPSSASSSVSSRVVGAQGAGPLFVPLLTSCAGQRYYQASTKAASPLNFILRRVDYIQIYSYLSTYRSIFRFLGVHACSSSSSSSNSNL